MRGFSRSLWISGIAHTVVIGLLVFRIDTVEPLKIDGLAVSVVASIPLATDANASSAPEGPLPPVVEKKAPIVETEEAKPKPPKENIDGVLKKVEPQTKKSETPTSNALQEQRSQADKERKVTDLRRLLNTVEQLRSEKRERKEDKKAQKTAPTQDISSLQKALDVIRGEDDGKVGLDQPSSGAGLSPGDFDKLRRQLSQCWNIPAAARGVSSYKVKVEVRVAEGGFVQDAQIHPGGGATPVNRVLSESVLRALWHPLCTPLRLPEDGYETWQHMIITFDPVWLSQG